MHACITTSSEMLTVGPWLHWRRRCRCGGARRGAPARGGGARRGAPARDVGARRGAPAHRRLRLRHGRRARRVVALSASLVGPGGLAPLVVMAYAILRAVEARSRTRCVVDGRRCTLVDVSLRGPADAARRAGFDVTGAAGAAAQAGRRNARPTAHVGAPCSSSRSRSWRRRGRGLPCSLRRPLRRVATSSRPSLVVRLLAVSPPSGRSLVTLASRKATRPRALACRRAPSRAGRRRRPATPTPRGPATCRSTAPPATTSGAGVGVAGTPRWPARGRLERGRRRVPRALGAHGGPVFPWLVVVDDRLISRIVSLHAH